MNHNILNRYVLIFITILALSLHALIIAYKEYKELENDEKIR